jgi:hypothetical protein
LGHPVVATVITATGGARLAAKMRSPGGPSRWLAAARVTVIGNAHAGRQLADATTSVWWPLVLPAAIVSRRLRRLALLAALGPGVLEWIVRRPHLDPVRFVGLRLLERGAYGLGVGRGAIAARSLGPLLPAVEALRPAGSDPGAGPTHK